MDLWFSENFPILLLKFTIFYFNHRSAAYWSLIVIFEVILYPKIFWSYRYANEGGSELGPIPYLRRANTYSRSNTWHWRPYARTPLPLLASPRTLPSLFIRVYLGRCSDSEQKPKSRWGCWGKSEREGSSFRWQPELPVSTPRGFLCPRPTASCADVTPWLWSSHIFLGYGIHDWSRESPVWSDGWSCHRRLSMASPGCAAMWFLVPGVHGFNLSSRPITWTF